MPSPAALKQNLFPLSSNIPEIRNVEAQKYIKDDGESTKGISVKADFENEPLVREKKYESV